MSRITEEMATYDAVAKRIAEVMDVGRADEVRTLMSRIRSMQRELGEAKASFGDGSHGVVHGLLQNIAGPAPATQGARVSLTVGEKL